jgi:hypothetical protein
VAFDVGDGRLRLYVAFCDLNTVGRLGYSGSGSLRSRIGTRDARLNDRPPSSE